MQRPSLVHRRMEVFHVEHCTLRRLAIFSSNLGSSGFLFGRSAPYECSTWNTRAGESPEEGNIKAPGALEKCSTWNTCSIRLIMRYNGSLFHFTTLMEDNSHLRRIN